VVVPNDGGVLRVDINRSGPGCHAATERIYASGVRLIKPV
jgi:hypothetical protein